jgi:hypothetical protein
VYVYTLGIFPRFVGIFRMKKSLRLPIKGGAWARVKGFTTFEASTDFQRFLVSLSFVNCTSSFVALVFGDPFRFSDPPTLAPTVFSAEEQLTMPPQKRSKKNVPTETDQEQHHYDEDNGISLTPEPSHTTDQERRAKHYALYKARAEKTTHTLEQFTEQDAHEDDDHVIDRELEIVQQKIQQLQKEKERFANQLQAKRKASEKLKRFNQAKEQI